MQRHLRAGPTQDGVHLRHRPAILGASDGGDLAQPRSRLVDAGRATGIAEFIAERFLRERPPLGSSNESQVAAWSCRQSLGEHWQDRQSYRRVRLLSLEASHTVADML